MRQTLSKGMVAAAAATSVLSLCGPSAFADSTAEGGAADSPGVLSGNNVQAPVNVPVNACGNTVDVVAALNPAFGNKCANSGSTGRHRKPDGPQRGTPSGHDRGSDRGNGSDRGGGPGRHGGSGHQGGGHHAGPGHQGGGHHGGSGHQGGGRHDGGGSSAHGEAHGSPGVGSGNKGQVPLDVPVNLCGNAVDVVGLLNPVFGNDCGEHRGPKGYGDDTPPSTPPSEPPTMEPPTAEPPGTPPATPPGTPPAVTPPSGTPAPGPRAELPKTGSEGVLAASAAGAGLLLGGAVLYRRGRVASRR
ncbi:chaplin [Streptomyces fructofermentans]|uniref:Chaplin domain-containing protein n=1 Tax=Streptomyces fructofermentans TaxID=152141 RepID=A0A918K9L6_9ACTN|nr:chaplin [Streptomyces fructofermentans]GGX54301.1 hypothetical protein GCM10010515_21900 [Streptomyces fructofermentans]